MKEVFAYGVPPVLCAALHFVGTVLEEQVIFAIKKDKAVGVIQPVLFGGEVELRTIGFLIKRLWLWCRRCLLGIALHDFVHVDMSPAVRREIDDLNLCSLTLVFREVPICPSKGLSVLRRRRVSAGCQHGQASDDEADRRTPRVFASADEEIDELSFDRKRW